MDTKPSVLVLGGGPDAEREVSLTSSRFVAKSLGEAGHEVNYQVIDKPTGEEIARWGGDVVFPVLHGGWGEGGPLQDLLEHGSAGRRPFVGCRGHAARLAMDKIATKMIAAVKGVPTAASAVFNPRDDACPLGEMPVVLKPIHEGSSVGVHICRTGVQWRDGVAAVREDLRRHPERAYLVERAVLGARELTVGVMGARKGMGVGGLEVLDPVEIKPAVEFYDYQAKYTRNDTRYTVDPELPAGVKERVQGWARTMFEALGCRHLARIDFLLGSDGSAWLLEANTMPGFTDHSLFPMAAGHRGMGMPVLCSHLVMLAASTGH
jgi:D-alanine-D-alanine ligase